MWVLGTESANCPNTRVILSAPEITFYRVRQEDGCKPKASLDYVRLLSHTLKKKVSLGCCSVEHP